jgi:RHS repeat-associated protein
MLEQMDGSYNNPYKFNAKELDEDTGLYYGARYYNPKWSQWYEVDPLAEKYPSLSPYVYCTDNPIRYIDMEDFNGCS